MEATIISTSQRTLRRRTPARSPKRVPYEAPRKQNGCLFRYGFYVPKGDSSLRSQASVLQVLRRIFTRVRYKLRFRIILQLFYLEENFTRDTSLVKRDDSCNATIFYKIAIVIRPLTGTGRFRSPCNSKKSRKLVNKASEHFLFTLHRAEVLNCTG